MTALHENQDSLFDQREHDFFIVDNAFIDMYGPLVGAYGIAVYSILVRHADKHGTAFPSRSKIARLAKCSVKTVDRTLTDLEQHGLLSKFARKAEAGDADVNLYALKRVKARGGDSQSLPSDSQSPRVATHSRQGRDSQSLKQDLKNKTHKEQVPSNDGRGANDAPADVASRPAGPAPRDATPKAKSPRAGRKPKAESVPNPLAEMIAQDLTGRATIQNRDRGLLWPIHDDIRALVGDDLVPGVMVWLSFREALEAGGKWAGVKPYNARNEFGRWAANGGAPTIAQIVAEFGGRAA